MPLCYIFTNLKDAEIDCNLEEKMQACIADTLKKPVERISVAINSGLRMNFAGKKQPGMLCQIHSIAVFDKERNGAYFPAFFEVLREATNLPASSITIELVDLPAHMAMNGSALESK